MRLAETDLNGADFVVRNAGAQTHKNQIRPSQHILCQCGRQVPRLPLFEDLTKGAIPSGSNILVEFDPASQWYNASLTIAAGWMRSGGITNYNVFAQPPENVRLQLKLLGFDVEGLEKEEKLRIIDWYSTQLGRKSNEKYAMTSLKVADLSIRYSRQLIPTNSSPFPGIEWHLGPDVVRLSDDALVLLRFNDEKSSIDFWRTRVIPTAPSRRSTQILGAVKGVYSEYVYKTLEASVDGIIDFKVDEEAGEVKNSIRIRHMRNVGYDSRWHHLKIDENFGVTLEE